MNSSWSSLIRLTGLLVVLGVAPAAAQTDDFGDFSGLPAASSTVNAALGLGPTTDADVAVPVLDLLTLIINLIAPSDPAAVSDDSTGIDDEDGLVMPASLVQGATVTIPVTVRNDTGANAFLNAWIDLNNDGTLADTLVSAGGERLVDEITIPSSATPGVWNITFTLPTDAATGPSRGFRFRLTTVSNPGPDGADGDGEVEDSVVQIATAGFAYGVAGGSIYQINVTTGQSILAADMVSAITGTGNAIAYTGSLGTAGALIYSTGETGDLRLGAWDRATGAGNVAGDLRSFGVPSSSLLRSGAFHGGFYWTILDGTDDLWQVAISGSSGTYTITSARKVCDLWSNTRAHGFGDFAVTPDGTMLAIGGRTSTDDTEFFSANLNLAVPVATQTGSPAIFQNGIALGLNGRLYGGLGMSSSNVDWYELDPANGNVILTVTNGNLDGVSDMTIAAPTPAPVILPQEDFGDSSVIVGASALRMNNLRLGALTDPEAAAVTNAAATGDDITGSDDEDGVTMPGSISRGATVTIPVEVFNNTIPSAYLNAWIDFNNDGNLNDSLVSAGGEKLANQIPIVSSGGLTTKLLTFTVPASARLGAGRGARFRLSSVSNPGPDGPAGSGEVEDYAVTIAPAAPPATLGDRVFLDADDSASQTAADSGIAGVAVRLYSSTDATRGNADDKLIGQAVTGPTGLYQFGGAANMNMLAIPGTPTTITAGPGASADDAEENASSGSMNTSDSDLELGDDSGTPQVVGLRFPGIFVPVGATITAASIQFRADESNSGSVTYSIQGENADNAATFTTSARNVSSRPRTTASTSWSPPEWESGEKGSNQLTPDLSPVVQEIVGRAGWASGNAMAFVISRTSGSARRTAESHASGSAEWPVLRITYTMSSTATILPASRYFIALSSSDAALTGTLPVTPFITGTAPADPHVLSPPGNNLIDSNGTVIGTELIASVLTFAAGGSNLWYDFGFFPSHDFGDFAGFPSASSLRVSTLRIGARTDTEVSDAAKNATATGDDNTGLDDEDGAIVPATLYQGQPAASLTVNVTNTGTAGAWLNAWIDFNRDNDTLDAGEQIATDVPVPVAATSSNRIVNFTVPAAAVPGATGVRVRLTSVGSPGPDGAYGNGEVEDYVMNVLAVRLDASMEVRPAGTGAWSPAIAIASGSPAEFRLTLTNSGALDLRDPIAIDLLPAPSDTGAVDLTPRNSAWRPLLTGPANVPSGVRATYSLVENPQRPEVLTPNPAGSVPPAWFVLPSNPGTVRSIKFDGTGLTLAPASSLTITWTMAVPWDATALSRAWNSAGVSVIRTDSGTRMPSFESARASIQALAPTGGYFGDRVWSDTNRDGLQSAGEQGVNGVFVELFRDNGDGSSDPNTDTRVDVTFTTSISGQAGAYRFGQFPPGRYFAVFSPADTWTFTNADRSANDAIDSDANPVVRGGRRTGITPVTLIDPGETDNSWDAGLFDTSGTPAVWAVAHVPGGATILGGRFTRSHGVARKNIVRVSSTGTVDTTFNPGSGFDSTVRSVALRTDGSIWVGGQFGSYNGTPTAGIALLSANGAIDTRPAQPDTTNVHWVGTSGNFMYLAGSFTQVGGISCGNIAKLKADGTVDTAFNQGAGANGPIYDGAVLADGSLILAGAFTSFHGNAINGVVKLKPDGNVDNSFHPRGGPAGDVYSLKMLGDGTVVLTGNFRTFDGTACNGTIRLKQNGHVDPTMAPSSLSVQSINSAN